MKDLKGKTAVITGAASGIGFGLAERCAAEGMRVVLADVQNDDLRKAEKDLETAGADVVAVETDVSRERDVENLARKSLDAFGGIHLLFNNAGVSTRCSIWESTTSDWQWVLGVNLWGVINGIRTFVPIMIEQDTECHIVNTSSATGLWSGYGYTGTYNVSKHGVVALSETLHQELKDASGKIGVSVFCPSAVRSRITTSERNRPEKLLNTPSEKEESPVAKMKIGEKREMVERRVAGGIPPSLAADLVFRAIRNGRFYIMTGPLAKLLVQLRMEDILLGRQPTDPLVSKTRVLLTALKNLLPLPRYRYMR